MTSRAIALKSLQRPRSETPTHISQKPSSSEPRRRYPRADLQVRARLQLADDASHVFEAVLSTLNISVGGLFFESSFFLRAGTRLLVELELPPAPETGRGRTVRVKGDVVRVETADEARAGFALRFTEYLDGSEVVLATHFLSPVLRHFIQDYAEQNHFDASPEYIAHTADVLAAWELRKAENEHDVWQLAAPR